MNPHFVRDENEVEHVGALFSRIFHGPNSLVGIRVRFPETHVIILEFHDVFSAEFVSAVNDIAGNDSCVYVRAVDPTPEEYHRLLGVFGIIKHRRPMDATTYSQSLLHGPDSSDANAPEIAWDTFAIIGDSCTWAIWAERWEGLAVIFMSESAQKDCLLQRLSDRSVPVDVATSIMALERGLARLPDEERAAFESSVARFAG